MHRRRPVRWVAVQSADVVVAEARVVRQAVDERPGRPTTSTKGYAITHVDLDDLADLVLDPRATSGFVRSHVESCAECTDRLAALFDVRRLASGEPLVAPPARVRERVLAQVGRTPGDAAVDRRGELF